jgi:hypothetical protein
VIDEDGREVAPILSCAEAIERRSFLPGGREGGRKGG